MKLNWISILILFLLVTNIGMVSTFLVKQKKMKATFKEEVPEVHHKKMSRKEAFDKFIDEEMGFTDQQLHDYKEAQGEFFGNNHRLRHEIKDLNKRLMHEMVHLQADTLTLDSIAVRIGELTRERKREFYRHYYDVKNICEPDQMKKLDSVMHSFNKNDKNRESQRPDNPDNNR